MTILLITSESKMVLHFSSSISGPTFKKKNIKLNSEKQLSNLINNEDIIIIHKSLYVEENLQIDIDKIDSSKLIIFFKEEDKTELMEKNNIVFLTLKQGDITKILNAFNRIFKLQPIQKESSVLKKTLKEEIQKLSRRKVQLSQLTNQTPTSNNMDQILEYKPSLRYANKMIIIGASIGGLNVMDTILNELKKQLKDNETVPPILYTQHITSNFANNIIKRVENLTHLTVKEAKKNLSILNNHIYMPLNEHFIPKIKNGRLIVELLGTKAVSSHSPSIDVMFRGSSNICHNTKTLSIILTGMGKDGVIGMGNLKQSGSKTIAQEPSTTVVPGIINECLKNGYIDEVLTPEEIVKEIIRFIRAK